MGGGGGGFERDYNDDGKNVVLWHLNQRNIKSTLLSNNIIWIHFLNMLAYYLLNSF